MSITPPVWPEPEGRPGYIAGEHCTRGALVHHPEEHHPQLPREREGRHTGGHSSQHTGGIEVLFFFVSFFTHVVPLSYHDI